MVDCPKCKKVMEHGFVYLRSGYGSALYFNTEEPPLIGLREKGEEILKYSALSRGKDKWLRNGYKCTDCGVILIDNV